MKAERFCCKIGLSNTGHIASTWAWRWPNIGEAYDPNRLALAEHSPTIQQGLNLGLTFLFARFFWVGWYSIAWNALVAILQAKGLCWKLETYHIHAWDALPNFWGFYVDSFKLSIKHTAKWGVFLFCNVLKVQNYACIRVFGEPKHVQTKLPGKAQHGPT